MGLFDRFYPSDYYESAYAIPYEDLYDKGYRGIIFDIDNTLVMHGKEATKEAVELFQRLRETGYKTMILSNNDKMRVKPFADAVGTGYIHKAGKPKTAGYRVAMDIMNTEKENTFFVGDQIFTDIWGANNSGIMSLAVKPIDKREVLQIVLKRIPEKVVWFFYRRSRREKK